MEQVKLKVENLQSLHYEMKLWKTTRCVDDIKILLTPSGNIDIRNQHLAT
jgi:hypothetical protein